MQLYCDARAMHVQCLVLQNHKHLKLRLGIALFLAATARLALLLEAAPHEQEPPGNEEGTKHTHSNSNA